MDLEEWEEYFESLGYGVENVWEGYVAYELNKIYKGEEL